MASPPTPVVRVAPFAICGLLAACVRVESPPRLSFDLPTDYSVVLHGKAADRDLAAWWRELGDAQLDQLIKQALAQAPDIAIAQARLAEARARSSGALRRFDPSGALQANAARTNVTRESGNVNVPNLPVNVPFVQLGRTDTYDPAFAVAWEIDLFGRKRATAVVAGAKINKAAYEAAGTSSAVAAAVADALFRVRGTAIEHGLALRRIAVERETLASVDARIARGMAAGVDRSGSVLRLNGLEAKAEQLAGELAAGKREVLVLIGRATDPLDRLVIQPTLPLPPAMPSSTPGRLLERRPDVLASKADLVAALGDQALARLDLFPNFTLLPGIGLSGVDRPSGGFSTSFWSIAVQGVLPILDRGRLLAQKRANDAQAQQAVASYEKSVQTAFGEADAVLTRLAAEARTALILAASERTAADTVAALEAAKDNGLLDPQALRDARQQSLDASEEAARARVQQLRRLVQAYKALGGGWTVRGDGRQDHHADIRRPQRG